MAASKPDFKNLSQLDQNERGQSVLEFLIMVPLLLGFVIFLVRTNTVIQMAIVDQQYARAQTLFLAFNSPMYPNRVRQLDLGAARIDQMTLGVSENDPGGAGDVPYIPQASTYGITRTKNRQIAEDVLAQTTPAKRTLVRVRNTTTLCTPSLYANLSTGPITLVDHRLNEVTSSQVFDYCGSTIQYE